MPDFAAFLLGQEKAAIRVPTFTSRMWRKSADRTLTDAHMSCKNLSAAVINESSCRNGMITE